MNRNSRLQIRMDSQLKKEATAVFSQMGLDLSSAVTIYFHQVVSTRRLPFTPSAPTAFEKHILGANQEDTIHAGSVTDMNRAIDQIHNSPLPTLPADDRLSSSSSEDNHNAFHAETEHPSDKQTPRKPVITVLTKEQLDERRKKIIDLYGTIDELREKDSNGTITPRESTALTDLEGFDFLEHSR